jgi:hypothetical protein
MEIVENNSIFGSSQKHVLDLPLSQFFIFHAAICIVVSAALA